MPVYQYQVLNGKQPEEIIEIDQERDDPPLTRHPLTKEPIRKILSAPSLSLRHTEAKERKSLSEENLDKHGFSVYHKDKSGGTYRKNSGAGPDSIKPE